MGQEQRRSPETTRGAQIGTSAITSTEDYRWIKFEAYQDVRFRLFTLYYPTSEPVSLIY